MASTTSTTTAAATSASIDVASSALQSKLTEAVNKIASNKKGAADLLLTLTGVELYAGYKLNTNFTVGAWAGSTWKGTRDAGVRVTVGW